MLNTMFIVVANLVPVLGVYLLSWSTFEFFIAYWFEAIIIGLFTFVRILCAKKVPAADTVPYSHLSTKQKIGYALFFLIWYSIFLGVFLFFITFETSEMHNKLFLMGNLAFWIPVGIFFAKHIVKFLTEWSQKMFELLGPDRAFMPAIKWVVVVLSILIVGGFFSLKDSDGKVFVIVFFVLKSVFEIYQLRKKRSLN